MQAFDSHFWQGFLSSYGNLTGNVQSALKFVAVPFLSAAMAITFASVSLAQEKPVKIVALGDSLTAGFGLAASEAFPARLARALKSKGIAADIVNAGVSGDTATGGLERLDWAVSPDTDAVIVELGANDMLRGIDPKVTRNAIDTIVKKLRERKIPVLLCGMLASPNLGDEYGKAFKSIYSDVAAAHDVLLYPFFLEGIAADAKFNQRDGLHPTADGVDRIVEKIMPSVEKLIERTKGQRGT